MAARCEGLLESTSVKAPKMLQKSRYCILKRYHKFRPTPRHILTSDCTLPSNEVIQPMRSCTPGSPPVMKTARWNARCNWSATCAVQKCMMSKRSSPPATCLCWLCLYLNHSVLPAWFASSSNSAPGKGYRISVKVQPQPKTWKLI